MQKLSLTDTQELVNSYVKTYGQSGAAQKLNEQGYRSPAGASILQAHIYRILNGSSTCLLAPDQENQHQEPPTTKEPIAVVPKRAKLAAELFANEELLQQEIIKTAEELREELEEERLAIEEMERTQPALVPCIGDRPHCEARHLERDIRISAVFNRRQPVEFKTDDEGKEKCYFGIPQLHHSQPVTNSRPYQPRSYGRNSLSSRDLSVREK
jgi:hypothetical protein